MLRNKRGGGARSTRQSTSVSRSIPRDARECSDQIISVIPSSDGRKPKLQLYTGKDDIISIDDWINLYEDKTGLLQWSDRMRASFLDEYLVDEALAWFAQNRSGRTWVEIVSLMKKRFGKPLSRPIREFVNLKYDRAKGFAEYFREKQSLAQRARLTDEQNHVIPLMIEGLPSEMRSYFVSYEPSDANEFYNTGLRAECATAQSNKRKDPESTKTQGQSSKKFKQATKRKPPSPCYICTKRGFENRFHWASDCRFKSTESKKSKPDDKDHAKNPTKNNLN